MMNITKLTSGEVQNKKLNSVLKFTAIVLISSVFTLSGFGQSFTPLCPNGWGGTETCSRYPSFIPRGTTIVFTTNIPVTGVSPNKLTDPPHLVGAGNASASGGFKRYSKLFDTNGIFQVYIKDEGDATNKIGLVELGIADPIGPITITPDPANSTLTCSTSSVFSASATGTNNRYSWSVDIPGAVQSIVSPLPGNSATINWNTAFSGVVRLKVRGLSDVGGYRDNFISITRSPLTTFTSDGIKLPSAAELCEGEAVGLYAKSYTTLSNTHHMSTFEWKLDDTTPKKIDNYTNSSSYSPSGWEILNSIRVSVKITLDPSVQCVSGTRTFTHSILAGKRLQTATQTVGVKPFVDVASVSWDGNGSNNRCQGEGSGISNFTAVITDLGSPTSYNWTLVSLNPGNPNAGTIAATTGQVVWDANFYGQARVSCTAYGCGGSVDVNGLTITVKKLPTIFDLTGPAQLCDTGIGTLQLSGSEAGVTYELYREMTIQYPTTHLEWKKIAGGSATSWSLPVAATVLPGEGQFNYESHGKYYVKAIPSNGCSALDTSPFTIARTARAPIFISSPTLISGKVIGCDGDYATLTANGGTDYEWHEERYGLPGCPPRDIRKTDQICRPKLKDWGQPNEINVQMSVSSDKMKIFLVGKDAICHERTGTGIVRIEVAPALELKKISPQLSYRCQGGGSTQFTIEKSGNSYALQWSLSNGAGNVTPQGINASIDWAEGFVGKTILKFTATGCNGEVSLSREITVHPTLEADENRVRAFAAQEAMDMPALLSANMLDKTKVNVVTNYLDGLGRPVQNVNHYASPAGSDIIELKRYDQYGRESAKYLPFVTSTGFNYNSLAVQNQLNYYSSGAGKTAQDAVPVAVTQYEASPLNKVLKQGAPGQAWQPISTDPYDQNDRTIKKIYDFNGADEIVFFTYDRATGQITAKESNLIKYYSINTLSVNATIDENQNEVREYTDKQGRTVCKKVQVSGSGPSKVYASTYYIYDDLGNLAVVLPPEAVVKLTQ